MISVAQLFHIRIQFVVLQKHVTIRKTNSSRLLVKFIKNESTKTRRINLRVFLLSFENIE